MSLSKKIKRYFKIVSNYRKALKSNFISKNCKLIRDFDMKGENNVLNISLNNSKKSVKRMLVDIKGLLKSDGYSIFFDGKLIYQAKNLTIGNHCWIDCGAVVYKNAQLPDNTIVVKNAFVTGGNRFEGLTNIAIAGIPAKVIKENVTWNRDSINQSIDNGLL